MSGRLPFRACWFQHSVTSLLDAPLPGASLIHTVEPVDGTPQPVLRPAQIISEHVASETGHLVLGTLTIQTCYALESCLCLPATEHWVESSFQSHIDNRDGCFQTRCLGA